MSEHPASDGLRARSPDLLCEVLSWDLRGGEADWLKGSREVMVALAPYQDCARRLGLDAAAIFRMPRKEDRKACVT